MAVREIRTFPDQVLTTPARPVEDFTPELQTLVDDMAETMYVGDGVGLAAPQVGVSLRVLVMDVAPADEQGPNLTALINPEIVEKQDEVVWNEGCLSFPELTIDVKRAARVRVRALDRHGNEVELEAEGLTAICLQHEIDHLDGVVFVDRVSALKRKLALREYRRLREKAAEE